MNLRADSRILVGLGLLFATGCVDICVLSGRPCDSAADCGEGQVCRLRRNFELPCLFAAGTCESGSCGSVADCSEASACCDPARNTCRADYDPGQGCDDRTCASCPEFSLWPLPGSDAGTRCTPLPDCSANGSCAADLTGCSEDWHCPPDRRCAHGACRIICSEDVSCPGADCWAGETCTMPVGTSCADLYDSDPCGGASCIDLDASNRRGAYYCTRYCSEHTPCPCGFSCVDSECRLP
ncbi:MAG: hypothetical protein ABIJ09_07285 [Pseudomonadota bacterium]